jgi:hypothetical protein
VKGIYGIKKGDASGGGSLNRKIMKISHWLSNNHFRSDIDLLQVLKKQGRV